MQHVWKLIVVGLALVALAGCGAEPDTAPIPAYPDATVAAADDSMAATIRESLVEQQQDAGFETDGEVYVIPAGTAFADIESFYNEELTGRDWTVAEDTPSVPMTDGVAAWEHGRNQAFLIMMLEDPISGDNLLMTLKATR